ncbi:CRISPR-associated endonuclease Cas1 [Fusobacterium pseudoperiodonticum]
MSSNLYVYDQGSILDYTNDSLVLIYDPKRNRKKEISTENLDRIIIFGDVQLTVSCIQNALKNNIPITFLSNEGSYFGSLEPTNYVDIKRQKLQFKKSEDNDFCLALSKIFVKAKIKNQRTLLFSENSSAKEPAASIYSTRILTLLNDVNKAQSIEELNSIVEKMNTFYFTGLSYFLGDDFNFTTRVKMPPKDPFNSMLSFGYTLLIYEIQNIILSKGLNPYIGFFASDEESIPCLCSDLMEEWRTILVDTLAFNLLKTKKLTLNDFVTSEKTGAVFLKKEARNIFINEFGELLKKETGNIIGTSHKVSYRRALEYQVHLLIEALESNCPEKYIPFEMQ